MTADRKSSRHLAELLAAALLLVAGWLSYGHYVGAQTTFDDAQQELQQAVGLVQQIEVLREKPDRARVESRSEQALAEAIEKSAAGSGVDRERIARIEPQQPRRAGDTEYLEHATVVQFDGITLAQLAQAVQALRGVAGLDQLRVSTLRVSALYQAGEGGGPENWNVELTLTYFVYSPKPAAAKRVRS
jgi:hypothetical protein